MRDDRKEKLLIWVVYLGLTVVGILMAVLLQKFTEAVLVEEDPPETIRFEEDPPEFPAVEGHDKG